MAVPNVDLETRKHIIAEALFTIFSNPDYDTLGAKTFLSILKDIYDNQYAGGHGKMLSYVKKHNPDIYQAMDPWLSISIYDWIGEVGEDDV